MLLAGRRPGRWGYVPRGPVPATVDAVDRLLEWAREQRLARLRLEPEAGVDLAAAMRRRRMVPAPALQPAHTLIVSLGAEDEMLASFKPKHRYNVRLALRRGVTVAIEDDAGELDRQHAQTAVRQGIAAASLAAYSRRLRHLPACRVYVARVEGRAVAAIMVARFAGRAYYLFGGSNGEHRELMPTYAVQWAAMRDAAAAGCRDYDLWGVPPDPDPRHPWHGLWQFKTGFGGTFVEYAGAWDAVLNPVGARLIDAAEALRKGIRRAAGARNIR